MRDDIEPESVVRLHLIGRTTWTHPNGTVIEEGGRNGYRAVMKATGETRVFMSLLPGADSPAI
jgi:hypothetical protein